MITINSLDVDGMIFTGIKLELPGAQIFIITNEIGYIMSASFPLQFSFKEAKGQSISGIVNYVSSIDDLLEAPLATITANARNKGWTIGMLGKDALLKIA